MSNAPVLTMAAHKVQALQFLRDCNTIVTGGADRTLRLWQLHQGSREATKVNNVKEMQKIADIALEKFPIHKIAIHHAVGELKVGDIPVIIAVSSNPLLTTSISSA